MFYTPLLRRLCASVTGCVLAMAGTSLYAGSSHAATDVQSPAWLDQINGARALDFVKTRDADTLDVLTHDPRYPDFFHQALTIAQSHDRIAYPAQHGGKIYNFWQDADHVRGIWRRTSLQSYRTGKPDWEIVLDLDALAKAEHANWVWAGAHCREPAEDRCLIKLSDGGEDASTVREFDLGQKAFVADGFILPHAKQYVAWDGPDSLLVSRPWSPGDLTVSSYPYIVRQWKRGTPLASAVEVARGTRNKMEVAPEVLNDGAGHRIALVNVAHTIFASTVSVLADGKLIALPIPQKADLTGMLDGRLIVLLNEGWSIAGAHFPAGSLVAIDPGNLTAVPELIFTAGPRQMIENISTTKHHFLAEIYDNVRGTIVSFTREGDGRWSQRKLALPANVSTSLVSASLHNDTAFVSVSGFITPAELWQVDAASGELDRLMAMPARFNAQNLTVDQFEATSTDGTKIPYFLVHRADLPLDGKNPVQLYAYGGFQVSLTPNYSGIMGKLWLEQGGVYALASIRGGGEFGPAWHEAGLNVHRQRVFDDFASVAKDMIARKITSPDHLAIRGGSNGGLLMGVEFTQHPELWKAVVIEVPLLDMVHFETMSAGASWTGEYGSVKNAAQRAFLVSISPVQNLKSGVKYPVPFIMTSTKDDRVGPVHARRFAARMDALHLPYFYDEQVEGGHSAGANLREAAQENALEYTYMWRTLAPMQ